MWGVPGYDLQWCHASRRFIKCHSPSTTNQGSYSVSASPQVTEFLCNSFAILQSWSFILPKWNFSLCLGTCYSISIIFVLNSRILQVDMQWVYNQSDSEFEYRKWAWINFRDGSKGWVWECCRCGSQVWMEWKMGRSFSLIQRHMIACMLSILVGLALGLSISSSSSSSSSS